MRKEIIEHRIADLDCIIEIEVMTSTKDIFDWLNQYIENLAYDWFDATDESFEILYKDGTSDYIASDYDGHKIRKQGIKSMLYNNPCTYMVYGEYEINEYGVANVI